MSDQLTALPEPLFTQLQKETLVLLHTTDAENGYPTSSAISWVYAVAPDIIRFALDKRSRLLGNLSAHSKVGLTVFGAGTVNVIYGSASLVREELENVPFKLSCFDIAIDQVRDGMFYGARISVMPEYEKTYDKRAAEKLDNQVFDAMKKA